MASLKYSQVQNIEAMLEGYHQDRIEANPKSPHKATEANKAVRAMADVDNVFDPFQVIDKLVQEGANKGSVLASRLGMQNQFNREYLGAPNTVCEEFLDSKGALEMLGKIEQDPRFINHEGETAYQVIHRMIFDLTGTTNGVRLQHLLLRVSLYSTRSSGATIYLRDYNPAIHSYVDLERKVIVLRPTVKTQQRFTELHTRELPLREVDIRAIEWHMNKKDRPLYLFNKKTEHIPEEGELRATVQSSYNRRVARTAENYLGENLGNRDIRQIRIAHEVLQAYRSSDIWSERTRMAVHMAGADGHTTQAQDRWYNKIWLLLRPDGVQSEPNAEEPVPPQDEQDNEDEVVEDVEDVAVTSSTPPRATPLEELKTTLKRQRDQLEEQVQPFITKYRRFEELDAIKNHGNDMPPQVDEFFETVRERLDDEIQYYQQNIEARQSALDAIDEFGDML